MVSLIIHHDPIVIPGRELGQPFQNPAAQDEPNQDARIEELTWQTKCLPVGTAFPA